MKSINIDQEATEKAEADLMVLCQHIIEHICVSWHVRSLTPDAVANLTFDEFDRMSSAIPNLSGQFVLLDSAELEMGSRDFGEERAGQSGA